MFLCISISSQTSIFPLLFSILQQQWNEFVYAFFVSICSCELWLFFCIIMIWVFLFSRKIEENVPHWRCKRNRQTREEIMSRSFPIMLLAQRLSGFTACAAIWIEWMQTRNKRRWKCHCVKRSKWHAMRLLKPKKIIKKNWFLLTWFDGYLRIDFLFMFNHFAKRHLNEKWIKLKCLRSSSIIASIIWIFFNCCPMMMTMILSICGSHCSEWTVCMFALDWNICHFNVYWIERHQ